MNAQQQAAQQAAQAACDAWGAELSKVFGKRAGDARYRSEGQGAPGSVLRQCYDEFHRARIEQDRVVYGRDEQGRKIA